MTFERHKMNKRVIRDLRKRSTIGIIFYVVVALMVVFADNLYERHPVVSFCFLAAMLGICLFRVIHLLIASKLEDRHEILSRNVFFVSVVLTSLIWGVGFARIMLLEGEYISQTLMTACICGLCAGGVVSFIPNRWLSVAFNIAMLIPAVVALLLDRSNTALVILIILYSIYMSLMAIKGSREYWNALENEHLLEIKSLELERLSNTDVLTGLYNRRYFDESFGKEWKRSGRNQNMISIILFDIDHFKDVNDTFGHQAGDEYLQQTAAVLNSVFKRDYDVVARYGGEEFIVLLPGINAEQARLLAEKVKQKIASLILDYQGKKVGTTISAGIMSLVPDFNSNSDSMISCADKALYAAKEAGRNSVIISGGASAAEGAPSRPSVISPSTI